VRQASHTQWPHGNWANLRAAPTIYSHNIQPDMSSRTFWKSAKASGVTYSATAMCRLVGRMYCPSVSTSTSAVQQGQYVGASVVQSSVVPCSASV